MSRFNQAAALAVVLSFGSCDGALAQTAHGNAHHWRSAHHRWDSKIQRVYSGRVHYSRYGTAPNVDPYDGGRYGTAPDVGPYDGGPPP